MKRSTRFLALTLAAVLASTGCASARAAGSPGPQSGPDAAGMQEETKTIAEATKSSRKYDGLFTMYQDTVTGAVHLAVREDQLGKEFIYFTHSVDGVVAAGHFRGQFRDNRVFSVRKHFDRIEFVTENTAYHFDEDSPLSRAATANISPSVLAVREIAAADTATGTYLVEADDIFLTEAFAQVKPTPNPQAEPGESFSLGSLSKEKTKYLAINSYPLNTDVVVEYVYENPAPTVRGGTEVTDPRNVSIRLQHSLIEMPENGYQPRYDDPRIGYFTDQITDLTSASVTPYRDVINRWNLVKKEPGATLSEPVEPIVWWIENTTPHEFRDVIRDATLAWNEAFEAAGFRNAVVVKVQPDDADWDAGDIRYNVLRWTSSPQPPFGGYGPSFTNPRTGQILGADVMLEYVFVTNRLRQEKVFEAAALNLEMHDEAAEYSDQFCSLGHSLHLATLAGLHTLRAAGAGEIEVREYIEESLYYLILHEVGHTLGLNHNMKASQMLSPEEIHDRELTESVGLAGSVMDYPAANLAAPGEEQGQFFTTRPGPYDLWAIEFGYAEPLAEAAAERERMRALLARSTEPALAFGNDADDMRAPGKALDPRVNINDMSGDAIAYSTDRFGIVNHAMDGLLQRYSMPGESYHELRSAYLILTGEYANAANTISRYIGGVYVDRAMAGQPGATQPFTPVSRVDQERAMDALAEHLFAPDAFRAPEALYAHLQMQRRGFSHGGEPEDPKIHDRVLNIQQRVLSHLLHPRVLTRMTDTRLYGNEYPLAEFMGDLTDAIFAADARGDVNTVRQNLQLEYVDRLAAMLGEGSESYDGPTRSAALYNLRAIDRMMAGKRGVNAETAAHTAHVRFQIEKALETE